MVLIALAVMLAIGATLVQPPATYAFPALAVAHALLPAVASYRRSASRTSRLAPVLALYGAFSGFVGFVGWLLAGLFVVEAPSAGRIVGAAIASLGLTALPLFAVRQADSTFGESEVDR